MSSLTSLMFLARDGMAAQTAAIDVAGQNVTNAGRAGYVRRSAVLETRAVTGGALGGVDFTGIRRHYDQFAQTRILGESGMLSSAKARAGGLAGLESWLAPTEGGIGDRMSAMFSAATELASHASDPAARATFLARAEEVALSFRTAGDALATRRADLHAQAGEATQAINTSLQDIAKLNTQIAAAQASGDSAADLRDARDGLIRKVSEGTGASRGRDRARPRRPGERAVCVPGLRRRARVFGAEARRIEGRRHVAARRWHARRHPRGARRRHRRDADLARSYGLRLRDRDERRAQRRLRPRRRLR
jgi:flagellar hook-associated protein FlgK